jgi:heme O synthase-like polyprenyltransferase
VVEGVRRGVQAVRLLVAGLFAIAGFWGFFLAAAAFVFQPAQVGPDHGAWGAIAGVVCLAAAAVLAHGVERDWRR